ncbi:MAG: hypothetical protein QOK43_2293 [Acidimicrobiaceae bacterium]|nr:hypothetical protein [Acidimicrobiaceae bacterium]
MRSSSTALGRSVAAGLLAVGFAVAMGPTDAGALSAKEVPTSMHGAVETQAVTVGNGALSLLVDPGTAYAYSTLDRDDYGQDSVSYTMTARGANVNLGTIAYAVLWAPPSCDTNNVPCFLSGSKDPHMPNTGLHEAKGFPGYAEALYPPPPASDAASQERVYKCIVNKDGPGSPPGNGQAQDICKTSDSVPMSAWAETLADDYAAKGFSRAAGFDLGVLAVRGSESRSEVRAVGDGKVRSFGYSNVSGISVLGGYIRIDNVYSQATIVSSDAGVDAKKSSSSCSFTGLSVAGQYFGNDAAGLADPRLQSALDQVAAATKYKVELIPPAHSDVTQVDDGKFTTGCAGFQMKFTDLHDQAPVPGGCVPFTPPEGVPQCVPALGNREEFSFGRISTQQAVNEFPTSDGLGVGGLDDVTGGGDFGSGAGGAGAGSVSGSDAGSLAGAGGSGLGSDLAGADASGAGSGLADAAGSGSGSGSGGRSGRQAVSSGPGAGDYAVGLGAQKGLDTKLIGAMTAAGGAGLLIGVLALIGVVNALAAGRRFRWPGFGE